MDLPVDYTSDIYRYLYVDNVVKPETLQHNPMYNVLIFLHLN